ncbi:hypothetical protein, partial [uncultured Muribaculum sp.]|uniref:hypothetical protein n=1 Tax=uncultured Muribaculum sp. TaxID=1918613 RepID=UPI0025B67904
ILAQVGHGCYRRFDRFAGNPFCSCFHLLALFVGCYECARQLRRCNRLAGLYVSGISSLFVRCANGRRKVSNFIPAMDFADPTIYTIFAMSNFYISTMDFTPEQKDKAKKTFTLGQMPRVWQRHHQIHW